MLNVNKAAKSNQQFYDTSFHTVNDQEREEKTKKENNEVIMTNLYSHFQ